MDHNAVHNGGKDTTAADNARVSRSISEAVVGDYGPFRVRINFTNSPTMTAWLTMQNPGVVGFVMWLYPAKLLDKSLASMERGRYSAIVNL